MGIDWAEKMKGFGGGWLQKVEVTIGWREKVTGVVTDVEDEVVVVTGAVKLADVIGVALFFFGGGFLEGLCEGSGCSAADDSTV